MGNRMFQKRQSLISVTASYMSQNSVHLKESNSRSVVYRHKSRQSFLCQVFMLLAVRLSVRSMNHRIDTDVFWQFQANSIPPNKFGNYKTVYSFRRQRERFLSTFVRISEQLANKPHTVSKFVRCWFEMNAEFSNLFRFG